MSQRSPFEVLGISPSAEIEVVHAAYRALARKYHPDLNPVTPPSELNARMVEINWAKDELERDLNGWQLRAQDTRRTTSGGTGPSASGRPPSSSPSESQGATGRSYRGPPASPAAVITVEPSVLSLAGKRGASGSFTASSVGLRGEEIRARFKDGAIEVKRGQGTSTSALFTVTVAEDFPSDVPDSTLEVVDVVAPGYEGAKVFVAITPLNSSVLAQTYAGGRIAPPRIASSSARISFGKHRGQPFTQIAVDEPGYLEWMLREGAGSRVERESARMALEGLGGGTRLPSSPSSKRSSSTLPSAHSRARRQPLPKAPTTEVPALPDPARKGGLLESLRKLIGAKK